MVKTYKAAVEVSFDRAADVKSDPILQISDHQQSVARLLTGVFLIAPALLVIADCHNLICSWTNSS